MNIKIMSLCCFLSSSFSYATEETETAQTGKGNTNTTVVGDTNTTVVVDKFITCTIF